MYPNNTGQTIECKMINPVPNIGSNYICLTGFVLPTNPARHLAGNVGRKVKDCHYSIARSYVPYKRKNYTL